jgi:hypothetical protein
MLLTNHGGVNIDRESFQRIVDWLDLNAQCYGDLFPNKVEQRRLDPDAVTRLREYAKDYFGEGITNQPDRALINPAQPDESRVLRAPLAAAAGGWGQVPGWDNSDDPGYKKMADLVDACIIKNPNENHTGWQPTRKQGGGESWIEKERAAYLERVKRMIEN